MMKSEAAQRRDNVPTNLRRQLAWTRVGQRENGGRIENDQREVVDRQTVPPPRKRQAMARTFVDATRRVVLHLQIGQFAPEPRLLYVDVIREFAAVGQIVPRQDQIRARYFGNSRQQCVNSTVMPVSWQIQVTFVHQITHVFSSTRRNWNARAPWVSLKRARMSEHFDSVTPNPD